MVEQGQYTSSGKTVGEMREESRRVLAMRLLHIFAVILSGTIIVAALLIWKGKIDFQNSLTLVLAISSTFSGLLGSAITFYFSSETSRD